MLLSRYCWTLSLLFSWLLKCWWMWSLHMSEKHPKAWSWWSWDPSAIAPRQNSSISSTVADSFLDLSAGEVAPGPPLIASFSRRTLSYASPRPACLPVPSLALPPFSLGSKSGFCVPRPSPRFAAFAPKWPWYGRRRVFCWSRPLKTHRLCLFWWIFQLPHHPCCGQDDISGRGLCSSSWGVRNLRLEAC